MRATGRALAVNACRAVAAAGIASMALWTSGCYAYVPRTTSEVRPNTVVTADITDVGRVALGERVGAEVMRIEGKVVQRSDTAFRLMVSEVVYLNGLSNHWQGQEVSLRTQDVKSVSQRTFSTSRTAIMVGAVVAGALFAIFGLSFLGLTSGDASRDKPGEPPPES